MTEDSLFVSVGRLTINLLEATDIIISDKSKQPARSWLKKPVRDQHYAFATIQLFEAVDDSQDLKNEDSVVDFETSTYPFATNEKITFGEEFLIENAKSSSLIRFSLSTVTATKGKPHEMQYVGETIIPIARLEENRSVSFSYLAFVFLLNLGF